jgi:hypothetical protein
MSISRTQNGEYRAVAKNGVWAIGYTIEQAIVNLLILLK